MYISVELCIVYFIICEISQYFCKQISYFEENNIIFILFKTELKVYITVVSHNEKKRIYLNIVFNSKYI